MNRLIFFPVPLPDEDFRSLIFRYHIRSGNSEIIQSKNDLFGVRSYKHTLFPKRLQFLLDRLPLGHTFTLNQFIYDHTWYGLYQAFFTIERHMAMLNVIKSASANQRNATGQPTVSSEGVISTEIKYCPQCVHNDFEQFGEIYLHREHQVSFLECCPSHSVRLVSRCPICESRYGSNESGQLLREPFCKNGHGLSVEKLEINETKKYLQTVMMNDLLYVRDHYKDLSAQEIRIKFYEQLFANGYITLTGVIQKKRLLFDFEKWFTEQENKIFNCNFLRSIYFKNSLLRTDSMTQFMGFYLLLAAFLSGSLKTLLLSRESYALPIPFGSGPWSCYNPMCLYKDIPKISKCTRSVINGQTGVFSIRYFCPRCGRQNIIQGSYSGVISSWTKSSTEVEGSSIPSEIALAYEQIAAGTDITTTNLKRRAKMENILANNVFHSRSEIRNIDQSLYRWLMRNDKEWLEQVLPVRIPRDKVKLDFKAMDKHLVLKIRTAAARIDPEYRLPIKRGTIINLLDPSDGNRFRHYHHQLPLSVKEIDKTVEDTKAFLIRSISRHYSKIRNRGTAVMTVNEFKSMASVSYHLHGDKEVDNHIRMFLQKKGALIDT
ncbi:TnsD family Tn7-like transposition protein [Paenibacillus spiritus]|uniref:TnsD family Tn7-like transposition protein n=1 Tax=Paenibacillus spiritus TaxID=2496557 RepID=UPI00168BA0F6|nr:TnsD family Tn7-like transposition protein [Paenibacillus spiritus]